MSASMSTTNVNSPFAYLQALFGQGATTSGGAAQGDALSTLFSVLGQETGAVASTSSAASSGASAPGTTNPQPQLGAMTLQALFALQGGASSPLTTLSALDPGDGSAAQASALQGQQSEQAATGDQVHRHHRMGGMGIIQNILAAAQGAASQTTTNADGSSTTTITYADGSTVTLTTPASSGAASSSSGSASLAGSANVTTNNWLERLIQMQAQLLAPTSMQNIATA